MLPTFDLIDVVKLSYIKMDKGHKYVSAIHSEDCLRSIKICFTAKKIITMIIIRTVPVSIIRFTLLVF